MLTIIIGIVLAIFIGLWLSSYNVYTSIAISAFLVVVSMLVGFLCPLHGYTGWQINQEIPLDSLSDGINDKKDIFVIHSENIYIYIAIK